MLPLGRILRLLERSPRLSLNRQALSTGCCENILAPAGKRLWQFKKPRNRLDVAPKKAGDIKSKANTGFDMALLKTEQTGDRSAFQSNSPAARKNQAGRLRY
ncbi:hypothetical protein [Polaromonas sp. YR568]|uniref:hypothetical protein n=1 Tax=Polaromonas sp. YR568 TaxID=1855301 RepID=UPI00398BE67D